LALEIQEDAGVERPRSIEIESREELLPIVLREFPAETDRGSKTLAHRLSILCLLVGPANTPLMAYISKF